MANTSSNWRSRRADHKIGVAERGEDFGFALESGEAFGVASENVRQDLDCHLPTDHREFKPVEGIRVQFRAEAFNITNAPAFGSPGGAFGTGTFGVISSAGLPRNIQIALKVLF